MRSILALLAIVSLTVSSGCTSKETCDPDAVRAFQSLPSYGGVEVDLHGSPGIGCTDTVEPADPDDFLAHYQKAMRRAGWDLTSDSDGVFGAGPAGGVRIDRLEGKDVGVHVLSPDEYSIKDQ